MTLDLSIFKNKPITSTASPLDLSVFRKQPIKSTATPLDLTAFQPKTSLITKQPVKPLISEYTVPERTPVARQDFKDVANMVIELGAIVPQAIVNTTQSILEAKAGKALGKFEIPLFKGQKIVIQGVQQDYEDRLKAGQSDREAFIGSSLMFGLDLAFTLGAMKSVARKVALKTPESLVSRQVIADTQTVRNYVAGRSNYLGVEVPPELKTAWSGLSSAKKKDVLKGITSLEKVSPNRLSKILGITEEELRALVPKTRIIASERKLPGFAPEGKPAFGLSIEKRKPVGFVREEVSKATKVMRLVSDGEVNKLFDWGDERTIGAMVFNSNLRKHFEKEIGSFMGKTMFDSDKGIERIEKILNRKLTYFMRRFDTPIEREGAEKMFEHIKKEFDKIKSVEIEKPKIKPKPQPTTTLQQKAKKYGVRYSQEMKDKVVKLYSQGKSSTQISSELNISSSSILKIVDKAGIKRTISQSTILYKKDIPKVIKMYSQGKNTTEISKELNLVPSSVARWVKEAGIMRSNSEVQAILAELGKTNIRGVKSKVPTKFGNITADSTYEAIRIKQLETDKNVIGIKRATRIPFGDNKHYVPDLEIKYKDGSIIIEEIKPNYKLSDKKVLEKQRVAQDFYKDKDINYRIITENDIGVDAFKNVNVDDINFGSDKVKLRFSKAIRQAQNLLTKSQLKDIYNKAKGVSLKSEEIVKKSPQQLSQEIKTGLKSTSDVVRDVSLKKTIPQQEKLHKSLTENGRVLVDDKGKQVFPKPIKENPTPLENPIIKEAKAGLKEEKELKKVQDALEGVNKKHGQTEIIIESLKKKGVSQEQINNIVLENGDRLVDTVKVKREKNGVLSATIRKDTLQEMEKDFTLDLADKKWIPTKTAMQKVKEGVKSGKETPLIYYELPQIFHDRTGLRDYFYDPVREGERNADKMKTAIYNEFEKAGLLNRGSWVTAERFALSKKEAEKIGRYYLTRQGKGGKTELSNLTPKEQKFVKTFDNVIKESEERFYKVAELNGKSPGKVENYAPIMTNQDYKLAQEVGDMDFIFRKHPAFFSLKQRQEKVPFDMYELDYRKVASRWIDQMANFNHLGEVGVQTKYLANSSEFKDIVGDKVFNTTNKWLKDTFNPQVLSPAEKGGKIVRQATSIASLGLNMASVVKQYLSIIPLTIIEKAPPKLTSKFAKDFGIKVSELPSIRERKGNVSIMDMQNGLRKAFVGPLTGADKQVAQLELNSLLDRNYKRLLKEGNSKDLSPEMQAQLIKQAQDTLDIWMGGMTRAQLPLAFRTELGKLLNMFIYPLTSQLNGFIYSVAKAKGFSKAEKFAEVMASMLAIAYMEQVITNLSPQWSDKKEMVWDTLSSLAGNIPLLSQAVFAIRTDQPITPSPILGSISRVFSQTSKYFDDNANAGDVAFAWGELFGMPKGIRRATEGVELIREDGVRDKNGKLLAPVKGTWEQIRGFLRGKYGTIATQDWIRNIGVKTADRQWFVPEVEFLQNGNYDRKEELYKLFDKETQDELYAELSEGQQKKLDKALRTPPKTLEHKKRLFREKIKKALEEGTMTTKEAIEKTNQFKQAIERLQ